MYRSNWFHPLLRTVVLYGNLGSDTRAPSPVLRLLLAAVLAGSTLSEAEAESQAKRQAERQAER